jgi:hypothetical protein
MTGRIPIYLVRISEDWLPSQKLLQHLVSFAETAEGLAQVAATWLLKRYQEAGAQFPEPLVVRLLELLTDKAAPLPAMGVPPSVYLPAVGSATNLHQRRARTRRGPRSSGAGGPNENCCR